MGDGPRIAMLSVHTSPLDQPGTGDAGGMNVYLTELSRALAGRGSGELGEVDVHPAGVARAGLIERRGVHREHRDARAVTHRHSSRLVLECATTLRLSGVARHSAYRFLGDLRHAHRDAGRERDLH